ncbi:MAG: histidinol-phosphate transaminase [Pseudomonadota bacterium]|nr:histidinol-phosphate transaminase [Pseudomonadota bacterium]
MNPVADGGSAETDECDEAWFAALAQPGVRGLRAYDPGHDIVSLRRRFSNDGTAGAGGVTELLELGANENPYGPSPDARSAILDQLHQLHRYPDPLGGDLKRAIARMHGVDRSRIMLGNGSHELLMQLSQVFAGPGTKVSFSRYGFAVFALAAQASGASSQVVEALPRDAAMPFGHDLPAIAEAIGPDTRLVYLANPNNPTGTWFGQSALKEFMSRMPATTIVVLDEAYAGFAGFQVDVASGLPLLDSHPNLVVTRTFSKAYALAGLRVGYMLGAPGLIAVMERVRESFNVNGPALAACEAALGDDAHQQWVCARNAEQRSALTEALRTRGLRVFPSVTNFLLTEFGPGTAAIESALVAHGVVLRPMGGYGLPHCLRITVGTREENRRLLGVLDRVLA